METCFSKKHEASYVFSDTISRISKILNDKKIIENLNSQTQLPYLFIDKPIPLTFNYSLIESNSVEHKKKLTWMISSPTIPTNIHYTFNLVSNTLDNTTLLVFEIYILNPEKIPQEKHKKIMCGSKEICVEMINAIDKALQMNYDNIVHYASILINVPRKKIWDHFIELQFLKDRNIENLSFSGKKDEVGTIVSWLDKKEEMKFSCIILKVSNSENRKKWKFKLKSLEGLFQNQEMEFIIIKLSEKETFVAIAHIFNEQVTPEILKEVEFKKKNKLNKLKQKLESSEENLENYKEMVNEKCRMSSKMPY